MNEIKKLTEIKEKIREFEKVNKLNAPYPYDEDVFLLEQLKIIAKTYKKNIPLFKNYFYTYLKPKYGPYISADKRKEARRKAEEFLKKEKNRSRAIDEYNKMLPPDYDKEIWWQYHLYSYLFNEETMPRPILRADLYKF